MWSDCSNDGMGLGYFAVICMLNHIFKGGVSCALIEYCFNGKKWNPCLEVERPTAVQYRETLSNSLN